MISEEGPCICVNLF